MKKNLLCSIILLSLFNTLTVAQTAHPDWYFRGYWRIDVVNGGTMDQASNRNVYAGTRHGGTNQQWAVMPLWMKVSNGVITKSEEHVIASRANGRVLDFSTNSGYNLYCNDSFHGGPNQIFTLRYLAHQLFEIGSPFHINGTLDKARNNNIYFGTRHGGTNQQFQFWALTSFSNTPGSLRSRRNLEIPRPQSPSSFSELLVKETPKTFVSETLIPFPMVKNDLPTSIQVERTPYYKLVRSQYYKQPEHYNSDITYYPGETIKRSLTEKWGMKSTTVTEVTTKLNASFTHANEVLGKLGDLLSLKSSNSFSLGFEMTHKRANTFEETYERTQVIEYTFSPNQAVRVVTYQLVDVYDLIRADNTVALSWEVYTSKNVRVTFPAEANLVGGRNGQPYFEINTFPLDSAEVSGETLSIKNEKLSTSLGLKIYPNPSNGIFSISYNRLPDTKILSLIVYNTQGQAVFEEKEEGLMDIDHSIDISRFSSGLYLIKVTTTSGILTRHIYKE